MTTVASNSPAEEAAASAPMTADLLIWLAPMPRETLEAVLTSIGTVFPYAQCIVAVSDSSADGLLAGLRIISAPAAVASWTLTAADFVAAYQLAQKHQSRAVLLLGPEASSLAAEALRDMADAVLMRAIDLAIPHYELPSRTGLINSGILYPLTRSLFATRTRYPLALDLAISTRMAERMANAGQRFTAINQSESLLWPGNEAAAAGFSIEEVPAGPRTLPHPGELDLNAVLALVCSSLFADLESKAAYWQRARTLPPPRSVYASFANAEIPPDITPMIEGFRLAYTNLREIWSLVLPPNSLLGLKRLSVTAAPNFRMPEALWARILYDFLLAHRLRTIHRSHLLGALVPLYLAWVASYINSTTESDGEAYIETLAAAFETEKPYLVSRWRWPDRFNP
jgi:hypothetical protein